MEYYDPIPQQQHIHHPHYEITYVQTPAENPQPPPVAVVQNGKGGFFLYKNNDALSSRSTARS
jgi:hypothetical protein